VQILALFSIIKRGAFARMSEGEREREKERKERKEFSSTIRVLYVYPPKVI
jgi:hypothetical protein